MRIGAGVEHVAAVDRQAHPHPVLFERGLLEIEHHSVGEANRANAQHRVAGVGSDRAGRAEIGVAPAAFRAVLAASELAFGGLVPRRADRRGAAHRRGAALEPDQRVLQRQGFRAHRRHHRFGGDRGRERLEPFVRALRRGRHLLVLDQCKGCGDQRRIGAGVGRARSVERAGTDIGDLLGDFGIGEPEFQRAAVFLLRRNQSALPFSIDYIDDQVGGPSDLEHVARAYSRAAERRINLAGGALEAAVYDPVADLAQQRGAASGYVVGLVDIPAVARDGDPFGQRRVNEYVGFALLRHIDRARIGARGLRLGWPIGEPRDDLLFDQRRIEIADHHQRGIRRGVFARPERLERGTGRGGQRLGHADRQPLGIARLRVEKPELVLQVAPRVSQAVAQFGHHHTAFAPDRGVVELQLARSLAHQHQRSVEQLGIVARQVELVLGLLEPGLGVGICAE